MTFPSVHRGARVAAALLSVSALAFGCAAGPDEDWEAVSYELLDGVSNGSHLDEWDNRDMSFASEPRKVIGGTTAVSKPIADVLKHLDRTLADHGWDQAACSDSDARWTGRNLPDSLVIHEDDVAAICSLTRDGEPYGQFRLVDGDDITWITYGLGPEAGDVQYTAPRGWSSAP